MAHPLSSRRFLLVFAAGVAVGVFALFALFHIPAFLSKNEIIHVRLQAVHRLLTSAYPYHTRETYLRWLDESKLAEWAAPGWNVVWLSPDKKILWTTHSFPFRKLPAPVSSAIETAKSEPETPPVDLQVWQDLHPFLYYVLPMAAGQPQAGVLIVKAPLPRFFYDALDLWAAAALFVLLLFSLLFAYQWRTRRYLRFLARSTGMEDSLPPLHPDDTLEAWTRRYISLAASKITEERDLFDTLFELLQDGILILDPEDRILRANSVAATMLGQKNEPLSGEKLGAIQGCESLLVLAQYIRFTRTSKTDEIQLPGVTERCPVAGALLSLEEHTGNGNLLCVMRDVSMLKRLETAGEEYATNVSHELKTPLTLILGYTETLLGHGEVDPAFRANSLRTIERHAKRIIRIVDDLLRLAWLRNESGSTGIPRTPVDVAGILHEAVALCNEWAQAANIAIETSAPENLVWNLNSGLIEEAIVNLVKNAILYALEGPVEVRARLLPSGFLELSVTDRGPGLKPDDAQRIFDRFYRADKSRSRASGGSGLGLPIVQQIVEAHHGTARVDTAPGAGCTFILEFPPEG